MIRIAIPNKGALSEESLVLLKDAGYRCRRNSRELMVCDTTHQIEFVFLRPRDIAVYVADGIVHAGITGRDLLADSKMVLIELLALNFGKSQFCYAIEKQKDLLPDDFDGLRVATSYPNIVEADMKRRGCDVQIVRLDGAVEISIALGVADAIADVVESGSTIREAGLKIVGESILQSEAILIAKDYSVIEISEIQTLVDRLKGVLVARKYALIEYDIPRTSLKMACELTPGIQSPTISDLEHKDWVAIKSLIECDSANKIMDKLKLLGATGIFVTDIKSCRL